MRASIVDPVSGIANASLECAGVTMVNGGVMVRGYERQLDRADTAQVWWCVPINS